MITFVRTAAIAPGKVVEATTFAHEIAKLMEKIIGHKVEVSTLVGGNPFRIAWVVAQPDLASVEANRTKLLGNSEYMKLDASLASYFLSPARDEVWRSTT